MHSWRTSALHLGVYLAICCVAPWAAGQLPKTASGQTPSPSDSLRLYYGDDPDTVNAVTGSDTVSEAWQRQVYEPLANRKFPNPDEWQNFLAESYTFDEKNLEYTIKLRKGVMWHPMKLPGGKELPPTEFTSKDVKFTFSCILNPFVDAAHIRSYYEDPEETDPEKKFKIKVTTDRKDKHLVKIKWTKPYFLADEFTLAVPIIPQHVYSVDAKGEPISFDFTSQEFAKGFNNHWANTLMCGTGPMIFKSWDKDQRVVFERNDKYWGPSFFFQKMVYDCIPNPNTAVSLLLQRKLDWGGIPEKEQYLRLRDEDVVKSGQVVLREFEYPAYRYVGYNLRKEFFKDARVRRALSHVVPVEQIIDKVFKGLAVRANGPFLPGSTAENPDIKLINYDLDAAAKLLDEAGWLPGKDGVREKKIGSQTYAARYTLTIFSDSQSFQTVAEIIKENSRQVGVDVIIEPAKWALFLQKLRKKEFDACMLGWALSWRQDPFQIWHGSQADVEESSNAIGYRNAEVDALIEKLRVTMNPEEQNKLYREIHAKIYADQPYTFLFAEKSTGAQDARIDNLKFYRIRPCVDAREWFASGPPAR